MNTETLERPLRRKRSRSRSETRSVTGVTQKALLAGVLLIALGLMFSGGRMLLAGLASYQTNAFIQDWNGQTEEPDPRAWTVARDAAQRAVNLYPVANGEYLDRLALVHSWKQFRHPYGDPAAAESRQDALDAYRAAVAARPTWPVSWARLAHAKLYLQQFDAEFDQALAQAQALGPWRPEINRELTEVGLSAWPVLSPARQQATLEAARRMVAFGPRDAQRAAALAQHTGTTEVFCAGLDDSIKTLRKLCQ